jgi:hypothetical protein
MWEDTLLTQNSMAELIDFPICDRGGLSAKLLGEGIHTFHQAIQHMSQLPYGRISDNKDLSLVLTEKRGTYTTRHAFLVKLARENNVHDLKLTLTVIHMHECHTAGIKNILSPYGLHSFPEARGYLKYEGHLFDACSGTTLDESFADYLIAEIEIEPQQIGRFKAKYHQNFIKNWLQIEKLHKRWTVEEVWKIREACIHQMSQ